MISDTQGRDNNARNSRISGAVMAKRGLPLSSASAFAPISEARRAAEPQKRGAFTSLRKNPVYCLSLQLPQTYKICNPDFQGVVQLPQRILTNPDEPADNDGMDNKDGNLICRVHDVLESTSSVFTILDLLGTGTFGQVFRCQKNDTKEVVAVKVVKNKPAYRAQGVIEVKVLRMLNETYGSDQIVKLLDFFEYKNHLCIVIELLSISVLDILQQNQFRGFPLAVVRDFTTQLLQALVTLQDASVIHCDLKPENILLCPTSILDEYPQAQTLGGGIAEGRELDTLSHTMGSMYVNPAQNALAYERSSSSVSTSTSAIPTPADSPDNTQQPNFAPQPRSSKIKVIDFGSACFEGHTMYTYIQSRFYRAPEVLLGIPYNGAIDMWSLGCVCAEMFLGLPLFPGVSQHNQLLRIVEMLGNLPDAMVENSKHGKKFFKQNPERHSLQDAPRYILKSPEEYAAETKTDVPTYKKYFRYTTLEDILIRCPLPNRNRMTAKQKQKELVDRRCFLDFVYGLLRLDYWERWTPRQAIQHPFITGAPFRGPFMFQPTLDPLLNQRRFAHMVQTSAFAPLQYRQPQNAIQSESGRRRAQRADPSFAGNAAVMRRKNSGEGRAGSYQQSSTLPYPIQQAQAQAAAPNAGYISHSYNSQAMQYPDEYYPGQSYGGSYSHSMMTPMSLGAMSFGSESGAFMPDFAMALQRPDRPAVLQASPTSSYQAGGFQDLNRHRQYAYSQPPSQERHRSMSLDHGGPMDYAPQSYQYPASMSYQQHSMPTHQMAGYAMARQRQHPPPPSIALGPAGYQTQYAAGAHMHMPMDIGALARSYTPSNPLPHQQPLQQDDDGSLAVWDPFFSEAAEEFDTETKGAATAAAALERENSADAKSKGKSHRRRRSNPQQNRRTPQKQRTPKDSSHAPQAPHGSHSHGRQHRDSESRRTRAQSWTDA